MRISISAKVAVYSDAQAHALDIAGICDSGSTIVAPVKPYFGSRNVRTSILIVCGLNEENAFYADQGRPWEEDSRSAGIGKRKWKIQGRTQILLMAAHTWSFQECVNKCTCVPTDEGSSTWVRDDSSEICQAQSGADELYEAFSTFIQVKTLIDCKKPVQALDGGHNNKSFLSQT